MANDSNSGRERGNSVHLLHMGAPGRTKGPRAKRGGISLPVHLWAAIDLLTGMRSNAYSKMGGTTKQSASDEIELAVETYLKEVQKEHGPWPVTTAERRAYEESLKLKMEKDAIDDIRGDLAKAS